MLHYCHVRGMEKTVSHRKSLKILNSNQNPLIGEVQTTQWTKGQKTIYKTLHRKLKIQQHYEEFDDTKRVTRIRISQLKNGE